MYPASGQTRPVIRDVYPRIEQGKFAVKRVIGEALHVWADVFADGHDIVCAALQFRPKGSRTWKEVKARPIGDDRWTASFAPDKTGAWEYRFIGWIDYALTWQEGLKKKSQAGIDVSVEILEAEVFLLALPAKLSAPSRKFVSRCLETIRANDPEAKELLCSEQLNRIFEEFPYRPFPAEGDTLPLWTDREKAAFSTWYEFFPRSAASLPGKHGTFADCEKLLPRVAELGFDTLYFPPVHPIGAINRKGRNNATVANATDVGSCWGIGSEQGGHTELHPELGSLEDFQRLIAKASSLGIEIAMDLALQCAPDHPWVQEHPQWFKSRPDGSIQYAENPPKKYQDIYPIYFETTDWKNLWKEILSVVMFWISRGIRVFRVDNPHTKPFTFWEWLIAEVRKKYPEVLFLSEAFTREKIMFELAGLGFTQSYTYYTWRTNSAGLKEYLTHLTRGPISEYFRPNFWVNTPDILPWHLQRDSEHAYLTRYFIAAALSGNCGVYGPVYELMQHRALPGKEEYIDSEKYEVRHWDWTARNRITALMSLVNRLRRENPALQRTNNLQFLETGNERLLAWLKSSPCGNTIIAVVNLNAENSEHGQLHLLSSMLGKEQGSGFRVRDLLVESEYQWMGDNHYISLSPQQPYHLFKVL